MVRVVNRNRPWWNLLPAIVSVVAVAVFAFAKGSLLGGLACLVAAANLIGFELPAEGIRVSGNLPFGVVLNDADRSGKTVRMTQRSGRLGA